MPYVQINQKKQQGLQGPWKHLTNLLHGHFAFLQVLEHGFQGSEVLSGHKEDHSA